MEQGQPCLMRKVKERWSEAGMPIRDEDRDIINVIVKLKKRFDAKKNYAKKGKLKEEAKKKFKSDLETTTLNLAPRNWRERILAEKVMKMAARQKKAAVLEDYVGIDCTRWWWCGGVLVVWWCIGGVVMTW